MTGLTLALLAAVSPAAGWAGDEPEQRQTRQRGDRISIFSGDIEIPADVVQLGSVVCIGGDVVINGRVSQDVVVLFGTLTVNGEIGRQATAVITDVSATDARIGRELVSVLGSLTLENSRVDGNVISILGPFQRDALSRAGGEFIKVGSSFWTPDLQTLFFWLRMSMLFVAFVALVMLTLIAPERIRLMASEAAPRYVTAFFVGLLGYLGMLVLLTLLSVTVIGVPVFIFVFFVIKSMGMAAIFCALGRRLGRSFGIDFSPLGAILLIFALHAVILALPLLLGPLGLIMSILLAVGFWLLVKIPAVGLVLITRFGTRAGAMANPAATAPLPPAPAAPAPAPPEQPPTPPPGPPAT